MRPGPTDPRGRARRVLGVLGVLVGTSAVAGLTVAGGALLHLNLPAARRMTADALNGALASSFRGRLVIERIGRVRAWPLASFEVGGVRASLVDPEGHPAARVERASARVDARELLASLLRDGELRVVVHALEVTDGEVVLDDGGGGAGLGLVRAFEPAFAGPPKPKDGDAGVRVELRSIHLKHLRVRAAMREVPPVDAEVSDARGAVTVAPLASDRTKTATSVTLSSARIVARGLPRGATVDGHVTLDLALPSPTGKPMAIGGSFEGHAADVFVTARGRVDGGRVDATVRVPAAEGRHVRAVVPSAPLASDARVDLSVEARGDLPQLEVRADAAIARGERTGTIAAQATVALGARELGDATTRITARVAARGIDARAFAEGAPASRLAVDAHADVELPPAGAAPRGAYTLTVLPGEIAGQRVPRAQIEGELDEDALRVRGRVAELGAPITFDATLEGMRTAPRVAFTARSDAVDLSRFAPTAGSMTGKVRALARGVVALGPRTIDAAFDAVGEGLAQGGTTLAGARASGTVQGSLDTPFVDARLGLADLALFGQRFASGDVHVRGPAKAPVIDAVLHGVSGTPRIEASTAVAMGDGGGVLLSNARVVLVRPDATVTTRADRVRLGEGGLAIDEAIVEGLGAEPAYASVRKTHDRLRVRLYAKDVDLVRVGRLLDRDDGEVRRGAASADVDLLVARGGVHGTVRLGLDRASFRDVEEANARLDASFDGRRVAVALHGDLGDDARLDVHAGALRLPGSPLEARSWRAVTGRLRLDARARASTLRRFLPEDASFDLHRGEIVAAADLERDDGAALPDVALSLHAKGMNVSGKRVEERDRAGNVVVLPSPWRVADVGGALEAKFEGATGRTQLEARVDEQRAPLVELSAKTTLDGGAIRALSTAADTARRAIAETPLEATLRVPRRRLDSLPEPLGTRGLAGEFELVARLEGRLADPRATLEGHLHGVKRNAARFAAANVDFTGDYARGKGHADLRVRMPDEELLRATIDAQGDAVAAIRGGAGAPLHASARVEAHGFPLESLSFFADRQLQGSLSGAIALDDLHTNGRARADIDVRDLRVGNARYRKARLALEAGAQGAHATVRLDQHDGFAEARAALGVDWGAAWLPSLDESKPVEGELRAKGFRAAALLPFLRPHVSSLDGRVDADAHFRLPPSGQGRPTMTGHVTVGQLAVDLPSLGERIRGARAKITVDGKGLVRVDDVAGEANEGSFTAQGSLRLDGVNLVGASASLRVPKGREVPIMMEGEPVFETYGAFDMNAAVSPDRSTMTVDVRVPKAELRLPDVSSHKVIPLEAPENVRIGMRRRRGGVRVLALGPGDGAIREEEEAAPKPDRRTVLTVHLGRDVEVRRGTDLRIQVDGAPQVTVGDEATEVKGQIRLLSGFLELQGKRFRIEKGTLTFTGEAGNPTANITAGYLAADGTQVYADFVGPIETGKLSLRSEPSHTEEEILQIILYGSDQGQSARSRQASTTTQAVGVGGGFATQGLNKALEGLTGTDFATVRIDTSQAANPRPEVEFQIARSISLSLATVFGRLPLDQPDRNFATVNWRFQRSWSLQTTFGDRGSSMFDLLWQRSY